MAQSNLDDVEQFAEDMQSKYAERTTDESLDSRERLEAKAAAALFAGDLVESERLNVLLDRMDNVGISLVK
jgi:hypothetical protein